MEKIKSLVEKCNNILNGDDSDIIKRNKIRKEVELYNISLFRLYNKMIRPNFRPKEYRKMSEFPENKLGISLGVDTYTGIVCIDDDYLEENIEEIKGCIEKIKQLSEEK